MDGGDGIQVEAAGDARVVAGAAIADADEASGGDAQIGQIESVATSCRRIRGIDVVPLPSTPRSESDVGQIAVTRNSWGNADGAVARSGTTVYVVAVADRRNQCSVLSAAT